MGEEVFVILLAVILILGIMAVAIVILLAGKNRQELWAPESTEWHLEMWNIYYGYRVEIRFVNTFILGRISLYESVVGRVPYVTDETISREHCMFYDQNGLLLVWNMSAVNPAGINGHRLNIPREVMPGDRLEMGNSVFLITRVERI